MVNNCTVTGNKGSAIATNNTYEANGLRNYSNILFSNCHTDGLLKAQSDDMTFRNCTFKEIRFAAVYAPTHITMEDCTISGGYGVIIYAPSGHMEQSKEYEEPRFPCINPFHFFPFPIITYPHINA